MSQYRPKKLRSGVVIQSGLNPREPGMPRKPIEPRNGPYRAVVINTYAPEDTKNYRKQGIECDVVLVKTHQFIPRVAVMQPMGAIDGETWVPKGCTRTLSLNVPFNAAIKAASASGALMPDYDDLDGDLVLVDFIEKDLQFPVIVQQLTHEQTSRKIVSGSGWSESDGGSTRGEPQMGERYLRHRGTELRINESGDLLIDTVGAHNEDITESPLTGSGHVRVRVKSGKRFTIECDGTDVLEVYKDLLTGEVHVDIGEDATEKMVLGNKITTWLLAHTHPTAFGPSGPPIDGAGGVTLAAEMHLSSTHRVK